MKKKEVKLKKGDFVIFKPIVTGRVYHTRKGVAYIEFDGGRGYVSPPYKVRMYMRVPITKARCKK